MCCCPHVDVKALATHACWGQLQALVLEAPPPAVAPEDAPIAPTVETVGDAPTDPEKTRTGASGIASGIRLENVSVCCSSSGTAYLSDALRQLGGLVPRGRGGGGPYPGQSA